MPRHQEFTGAIFDLDDTLLDNGPADQLTQTLHARSRLAAIVSVAEEFDISELASMTPEENVDAFRYARAHTLESAIWNALYMKGLAPSNETRPDDQKNALLVATITERKNGFHRAILTAEGVEVPGATSFIRKLAAVGMQDHLAMATQAIQWDVDFFLDKYDLRTLFPDERIVNHDMITRPKPDKQAFDKAFLSLKLPESERRRVLGFEDNPRGILSAKAAGLFVCAITTRLKRDDPLLLETEPDFIADSFQEFSDWLELPELTAA